MSWVVPASHYWESGVRQGMQVVPVSDVLIDFGSETDSISPDSNHAFRDAEGRYVIVSEPTTTFSSNPVKFSLWGVGAIFVGLGAAAVIRRPGYREATCFGIFAAITSYSLATGLVSTGTGYPWAMAIQFVTLLGAGATCLVFTAAFSRLDRHPVFRFGITPANVAITLAIAVGYAYAFAYDSGAYELVRSLMFAYVMFAVGLSIAILAGSALLQSDSAQRKWQLFALSGIALGTLPFILFTLGPNYVDLQFTVPIEFTVLAVGFIPLFFAYAIIGHGMLGIRRLVHRGMAYILASFGLIVAISIALFLGTRVLFEDSASGISLTVLTVMLAAGVLMFFPLRIWSRKLLDRLLFGGATADYSLVMEKFQRDLFEIDDLNQMTADMARAIADWLRVESVLIFLGDAPGATRLGAEAGARAAEVRSRILPEVSLPLDGPAHHTLVNIGWQSESLLFGHLSLAGAYHGYFVVGPKIGGEVFLQDEQQQLQRLMPFLSLSIHKSVLSDSLRELNKRLTSTEENERRRIAMDIHDGPLQKAILLGGMARPTVKDPEEVARALAGELRAICSQLRPAVLDSSGVVTALEWLLDVIEKRYHVQTNFELRGLDFEDRFDPNSELTIFRIVQEATNNCLKHAEASLIMVDLELRDGKLHLEVEDDGKGFDVDSTLGSSFGLIGMRERLQHAGGRFSVQSEIGIGTVVSAELRVVRVRAKEVLDGFRISSLPG